MYLEIIALLVTALSVYHWWNVRQFKKRGIPYSWPIPLFGNNLRALLGRTTFPMQILELYNRFKSHPFYGVFEFTNRIIIIRDLEIIKSITIKDFGHFTDHRTRVPDYIEPIVARNLAGLKGNEWKTARNTLTPAFTSSKMKLMFELVSECGRQLTKHIHKHQQQEGEFLKIDLKELYTRYTNDVVATTAFGISCNSLEDKDNKFYKMGRKVTNISGKVLLRLVACMTFPKLAKLLRMSLLPVDGVTFFKQLIFETLRTREDKNIIRPDMIQLLMEAKKVQKDLSDDDIAAHAFTFFAAGFETSSTLMCFTTLMLAMHPDIQKKLQGDIDEVFTDEDQIITYEALRGLTYLDMVISETLRLYPPAVATDRVCVKSYTIPQTHQTPQLRIEEGEFILIPIIGIHRDPDYFPDPESFQPERFSEENKHSIKPFTYLPFGIGPRNCIGNRFALMEVKTALAYLLARFDFKVIDKTPLPIKLTNNMRIEGGFWIGITPRNK